MTRFALIIAGLLALGSPAMAQKLGQTIDVGGWKVTMDKNKDGSTGCSAMFVYDDKSIIGFTVDNDDTHMFLVSEPAAKMKEGQQTPITYRVDRLGTFSGVGIAASPTMLVVPITANYDKVYSAFMAGNTLFIKLGGEEFEEPLDGSSKAISALSACQDNLPKR